MERRFGLIAAQWLRPREVVTVSSALVAAQRTCVSLTTGGESPCGASTSADETRKRLLQRNVLALQRKRTQSDARRGHSGPASQASNTAPGSVTTGDSVYVAKGGPSSHTPNRQATAPLSWKASPLLLDAPFTPIEGEAEAAASVKLDAARRTSNSGSAFVAYLCGGCGAPLFTEADLAAGEAPCQHPGGWPCFVAARSHLKLRSVSQRVVAGATAAVARPTLLGGVLPPARSMAQRGLAVERDLYLARSGGGFATASPRTWRETCLRDANQRADPHYIEGCCSACGKAICRVVVKRRPHSDWEEQQQLADMPGGNVHAQRMAKKKQTKGPKETLYITTAAAVRAAAIFPTS